MKRGRPQKADGEAKKLLFQIRMTKEERQTIHEAAAAMSLDASAWARSLLLSQARKVLGKNPR